MPSGSIKKFFIDTELLFQDKQNGIVQWDVANWSTYFGKLFGTSNTMYRTLLNKLMTKSRIDAAPSEKDYIKIYKYYYDEILFTDSVLLDHWFEYFDDSLKQTRYLTVSDQYIQQKLATTEQAKTDALVNVWKLKKPSDRELETMGERLYKIKPLQFISKIQWLGSKAIDIKNQTGYKSNFDVEYNKQLKRMYLKFYVCSSSDNVTEFLNELYDGVPWTPAIPKRAQAGGPTQQSVLSSSSSQTLASKYSGLLKGNLTLPTQNVTPVEQLTQVEIKKPIITPPLLSQSAHQLAVKQQLTQFSTAVAQEITSDSNMKTIMSKPVDKPEEQKGRHSINPIDTSIEKRYKENHKETYTRPPYHTQDEESYGTQVENESLKSIPPPPPPGPAPVFDPSTISKQKKKKKQTQPPPVPIQTSTIQAPTVYTDWVSSDTSGVEKESHSIAPYVGIAGMRSGYPTDQKFSYTSNKISLDPLAKQSKRITSRPLLPPPPIDIKVISNDVDHNTGETRPGPPTVPKTVSVPSTPLEPTIASSSEKKYHILSEAGKRYIKLFAEDRGIKQEAVDECMRIKIMTTALGLPCPPRDVQELTRRFDALLARRQPRSQPGMGYSMNRKKLGN
jgi:hypothetical protein